MTAHFAALVTRCLKADARPVLAPYSARMKKRLEDAESCCRPKLHPSRHDISRRFPSDSSGVIRSRRRKFAIRNLKSSPREMAGSNAVQPRGRMERHASSVGKAWQAISRGKIKRSVTLHHPRFPEKLPAFFIVGSEGRTAKYAKYAEGDNRQDMITDVAIPAKNPCAGRTSISRVSCGLRFIQFLIAPRDLPAPACAGMADRPSKARQAGPVLDIVVGSNTTGSAAAGFVCNMKSAISNQAQRGASAFRFVDDQMGDDLATLWSRLQSDDVRVEVNRQQQELMLRENGKVYGTQRKSRRD